MKEKLRLLNPEIQIYSVCDPKFKEYGEVITTIDTTEVIEKALKINRPVGGASYTPSISELENIAAFDKIRDEYFGGMDIQIGLCWGYNTMLNALEYHKCTEINIAATDMLVFLGRFSDIRNGMFCSDDTKAFFVPQGTVIELYNDTLHYCPCQTNKDGFYSVVVLMNGTNGPLKFVPEDNRIIGHNKWVIWHKDAAPENGYIGICGKNLDLKF